MTNWSIFREPNSSRRKKPTDFHQRCVNAAICIAVLTGAIKFTISELQSLLDSVLSWIR